MGLFHHNIIHKDDFEAEIAETRRELHFIPVKENKKYIMGGSISSIRLFR